MGKIIELPEALDVRAPAGLVEEVMRRCGRNRKLVAQFVAEAIEEKLRATDDAGDKR